MAQVIEGHEPERFAVGETVKWKKSLAEFPPGDGWTLKYFFRGPSVLNITALADGEHYEATIASAASAQLSAGEYYWQAWVENAGGEKHRVETGRTVVEAGLESAVAGYDGRSQAERDLEAVRAALAGKLTVAEYQIAGRSLKTRSKDELMRLEQSLASRVNAERRAERMRDGAPFFQTVNVRFR